MASVKEFSIEEKLMAVINLQNIDSKIDQINTLKGELPAEIQDLEDELLGLQTRIKNVQSDIEDIDKFINDKRLGKKDAEDLIVKYEKQSDEIKNKREYDAILKEIESQELEIKHIEKQIRDANGVLKEKKNLIESIEGKIDRIKTDLELKQEDLSKILVKTIKEEEELSLKSDALKVNVDPKILISYNKLRSNYKNGLAVVSIERESCGGCHNLIPPQRQAEITNHKKIIICEHCGRILVDKEFYETQN